MYLDLLLYLLDARRRGRWTDPVTALGLRAQRGLYPFTTPSGAWVRTRQGWRPANADQPVLP
jgi:hypothetical protein